MHKPFRITYIEDVIEAVGKWVYLDNLHNVRNRPISTLISHSDECADCTRFLGYYQPVQRADGTFFYPYEKVSRPLYPACRFGIDMLIAYYLREVEVPFSWKHTPRHGGINNDFSKDRVESA